MKTYISGTAQEIQNPDMSKGYTYPGRIKTGTQYVAMKGSVETFPPDGLRERKDIYEDCLYYVEGTHDDDQYTDHPTREDEIEAALTELAGMIADNAARLDEQEVALVDVAAVAAGKE